MQQRGDLSVEEILESIKRVIDRENREALEAQPPRRDLDGARPQSSGPRIARGNALQPSMPDVLDLGAEAMAQDDESGLSDGDQGPWHEGGSNGAGANGGGDEAGHETALPHLVAGSPKPAAGSAGHGASGAPALLTEQAANGVRRSLATFAALSQGAAGNHGHDSLIRQTARDMLQPMLAQWLEANLPAMVETLVKAEIARILGIDPAGGAPAADPARD